MIKDAPAVCLLVLPLALIVAAYYPGHITFDGIWLLSQARSNDYNDMQPPILAFLWRPIDRIWSGSGPILILDQTFLIAGIFLVLRRFYAPLAAAFATTIIILLPPVLGLSGMIAKDTVMLSCFVLAVGLMLTAEGAGLSPAAKLLLIAIAGLLLLMAQLSRVNAFPLTAIAGYALLRVSLAAFRPRSPGGRAVGATLAMLAASCVIFATLTMMLPAVNRHLLHAREMFAYRMTVIYDLAALSVETGTLLVDRDFYPSQDLERLKQAFFPDTVDSVIADADESTRIHDSTDPAAVRSLTRQWRDAVLDHPGAYLAVRARLFSWTLGLERWACAPFFVKVDANPLGLEIANKGLNDVLVCYLEFFRNTIFNRVWVYALLSLIGTVLLYKRADRAGNRTLAIAGGAAICYVLPYFLIAPSCEVRYVGPMIVMGILLAAVAGRQVGPGLVRRWRGSLAGGPNRRREVPERGSAQLTSLKSSSSAAIRPGSLWSISVRMRRFTGSSLDGAIDSSRMPSPTNSVV